MRGADGDVGAGAQAQAGPRRHHSGGRQVKIAIIAVVIIAVVIIALFGSKKLPH
jgi:hypothetical protein